MKPPSPRSSIDISYLSGAPQVSEDQAHTGEYNRTADLLQQPNLSKITRSRTSAAINEIYPSNRCQLRNVPCVQRVAARGNLLYAFALVMGLIGISLIDAKPIPFPWGKLDILYMRTRP